MILAVTLTGRGSMLRNNVPKQSWVNRPDTPGYTGLYLMLPFWPVANILGITITKTSDCTHRGARRSGFFSCKYGRLAVVFLLNPCLWRARVLSFERYMFPRETCQEFLEGFSLNTGESADARCEVWKVRCVFKVQIEWLILIDWLLYIEVMFATKTETQIESGRMDWKFWKIQVSNSYLWILQKTSKNGCQGGVFPYTIPAAQAHRALRSYFNCNSHGKGGAEPRPFRPWFYPLGTWKWWWNGLQDRNLLLQGRFFLTCEPWKNSREGVKKIAGFFGQSPIQLFGKPEVLHRLNWVFLWGLDLNVANWKVGS